MAGTSSTPVSGLPSPCPHSDWPATSRSWSLQTRQVLGNIFAISCTASSLPHPWSSDGFQKNKATIYRAVFQPWPSLCQQNAQQQHTQGADFRSAEICLDRGLNVFHFCVYIYIAHKSSENKKPQTHSSAVQTFTMVV